MKKILLIIVFVLFASLVGAQVSKTIDVATAGTLSSLLTAEEKATITDFVITGNIDARDVKCMRDEMTVLGVLDIVGVNIKEYKGYGGTNPWGGNQLFIANQMPNYSFCYQYGIDKPLKNIILPSTLISIGESAFSGCSGLLSIDIPNSVTSIGASAFSECSGLLIIDIPNSVTIIGESAFSGCNGLTAITIPNTVLSLGGGTFSSCNSLKNVTLPNSITSIPNSIFWFCGNLNSVSIPNSVTSIGSNAFSWCESLTNIVIPNSVTNIGMRAFSHSGLSNVIIPSSVTSIEEGAFEDCFTIENFIVESSNLNFSTIDGVLFNKNKTSLLQYPYRSGKYVIPNSVTYIAYAFPNCWRLTDITIPNSVTNIEGGAFMGCVSLSTLTIPSSVTKIGEFAFGNCSGLKIINSLSIVPPITINGCFSWCTPSVVYVPSNTGNLYKASSEWSSLNIVEEKYVIIHNDIAGGLNSALVNGGFEPLSSITQLKVTGNLNKDDISGINTNIIYLKELDLSDSKITNDSFPAKAFQDNKLLSAIKLPTTIQTIGDYSFSGCSQMSGELFLPLTLTSIGNFTFANCNGLNGSLEISNGVKTIGDNAFYGCTNFTGGLTFPNSLKSIGSFAFYNCNSFTGSLTIPNSVKSIGASAFQSCTSLNGSLAIGNGLTTIEKNTFSGCTALNGTITIPNTVNSIGSSAFSGCKSFTGSLIIPNSVKSIGSNSFYYCLGISSITIPNSISSIESSVFSNCRSITEILIPNSVNSIGDWAFYGCSGLQKILVERIIPPTIFAYTFRGFSKETCSLIVPTGTTETYKLENFWNEFFLFSEKNFDLISRVSLGSISKPKIYSTQSEIIIEGTSKGETITLYTLNGKQLQTIKSQGERIAIPATTDAVYLVKTAGKTFKVML